MKIHALTTGTVSVKQSFLFASNGPRRQLDLFLPGAWSDPLPIHCWAIEHQGVVRVVDTGETAAARNVPFARMHVTRDQELPAAMAAVGLALGDVSEVVLTHAHGDHIDGLVHVHARVLINDTELRYLHSTAPRVMRRASAPAAAGGVRARAVRTGRRPVRGVCAKPCAQRRRTHRCGRHAWTHSGPHFGDLHR